MNAITFFSTFTLSMFVGNILETETATVCVSISGYATGGATCNDVAGIELTLADVQSTPTTDYGAPAATVLYSQLYYITVDATNPCGSATFTEQYTTTAIMATGIYLIFFLFLFASK